MSEVKKINESILKLNKRGKVSDGYHTFDELYDHRIALFIALLNVIDSMQYLKDRFGVTKVWKSWFHSDGSSFEGWFIAGMETNHGQITYHLPGIMFHKIKSPELPLAPEFDGHTSDDVLMRLQRLFS